FNLLFNGSKTAVFVFQSSLHFFQILFFLSQLFLIFFILLFLCSDCLLHAFQFYLHVLKTGQFFLFSIFFLLQFSFVFFLLLHQFFVRFSNLGHCRNSADHIAKTFGAENNFQIADVSAIFLQRYNPLFQNPFPFFYFSLNFRDFIFYFFHFFFG